MPKEALLNGLKVFQKIFYFTVTPGLQIFLHYICTYNASQKHVSTLLHTYELNGFFSADRSCCTAVQQNIFLNSLKLVAHFFTLLFGTFCVQIGQSFGARKNLKLTTFSFENSDFTVFKHFSKTHCASKD